LRRYRVAARLSQEELAERAGLSGHGICDLERRARTRPYPATIQRLAKALSLNEHDRAAPCRASRTGPDPEHETAVARSGSIGVLPLQLTSFIGREHHVPEVRSLVEEGGC
jgi:transcriptional regulator with XRE-family HTH domain